MNHSTPGLPVHHQLQEFTQTHVCRVSDAIQSSHPLSSPSPPALNPSQHRSLFQWVNSSHEVAISKLALRRVRLASHQADVQLLVQKWKSLARAPRWEQRHWNWWARLLHGTSACFCPTLTKSHLCPGRIPKVFRELFRSGKSSFAQMEHFSDAS